MSEPVVPRLAATVMLLRDRGDLEVLLLQRSSSTPFVPGAHVFPGGAVDPSDGDDHSEVVTELAPADADRILEVERGGMAFWVAAVRECLEEAGILLAQDSSGEDIDTSHPALSMLEETRRAIEDGEHRLLDHCRAHQLRLPLHEIAYVSRWITPAESPRRYDARFFAAAVPEGQETSADGWEAIHARWWQPSNALEAWQAGDIHLIEPTVASLELLTEFCSVREAMTAFHTRRELSR